MKVKLKLLLSGAALLISTGVFAQDGIDTGVTSWMLTSTTLVLLMVPGLAMFYGGLVGSKNVLGTMMHSFVAMGVMTLAWVLFGYSMSFGNSVLGGWFGWNSDYFLLQGIDESVRDGIPEYVFAMFQGKFAIITPAILAGAIAERVNFKGFVVFILVWGILVYNPLCHWVWFGGSEISSSGFLHSMGAIDFAGGTVVHISAGVSGLVAALYLGKRRGYKPGHIRPSNLVMTMMGAGLLWVGWFGFNAGSSVQSGLATAQALTVTQIAAAAGAVAWMIIEGVHQGKASALGFASGILAGLVAITPAAGDVTPFGAIVLGTLSSFICYMGLLIKNKKGYDDSLDAFGIHGLGGIVGAIMLVFFMRGEHSVAEIFSQFGIQIFAVIIAIVYAAVVTLGIVFIIEKTIGLRASEIDEMAGLDDSFHGERGYGLVNAQ